MTGKIADVSWTVITLRNGKLFFNKGRLLSPLRWREPKTVIIGEVVDLFHEDVPDEWIDKVFAVMALAPQHQFIVLTKRSKRMRDYFRPHDRRRIGSLGTKVIELGYDGPLELLRWPLPNVALGVTAEDQERVYERIPDLLATPAARRFISIEPMLGPIDLTLDSLVCVECPSCVDGSQVQPDTNANECRRCNGIGKGDEWGIDLVICGGESGPDARPMHPDWPRSLRDQCAAAGVPFNFKQWGEWETVYDRDKDDPDWRHCPHPQNTNERCVNIVGGHGFHNDRVVFVKRVGKRRAGRLLDGVEHDGGMKS